MLRAVRTFAALSCLTIAGDRVGAVEGTQKMQAATFAERADGKVAVALERHDFAEAARIARGAYEDWRAPADPAQADARCQVLVNVIGELYSRGTKEGNAIGHEYALAVLSNPDQIPAVRAELDLVHWILNDLLKGHYFGRHWVDFTRDAPARAQAARLCCHATARVYAERDPAWNAAEIEQLKNRLNAPMFSGPAADGQREHYQRESTALSARYQKQKDLHRALNDTLPGIERWLVRIYSQRPAAKGELAGYLKEYGLSETVAKRVLNQVPDNPLTPSAKDGK